MAFKMNGPWLKSALKHKLGDAEAHAPGKADHTGHMSRTSTKKKKPTLKKEVKSVKEKSTDVKGLLSALETGYQN